uniref:Adenine DNA glycosylase n=1 Tax=Lates calcarifer TaxID=8187 RepID=A0A4W6EZJ2_LATCA
MSMSRFRLMMHRSKRAGQKMVETAKPKQETTNAASPATYHTFPDPAHVVLLRSQLLSWYDREQRELPWRTLAVTEPDLNIRTYAVLVSEIMLQQTQVATVIDYYNRWMKRWPTVEALAAATLEEVNQMWAGLGYYSGGKDCMRELRRCVVTELKGQMPRTVDSLLKQLPGVGRYTAAAVGSIALGQPVDGNVIRVLCRLRAIGADSTSPAVTRGTLVTNTLVDPERPGDFNQAMMELGARVCTPKGPLCSQCPVQSHCHSYRKRKTSALPDIEDCVNYLKTFLLSVSSQWDVSAVSLGALGRRAGRSEFPKKAGEEAARVERTLTCVVVRPGEEGEDEYLLTQRPNKGQCPQRFVLLAGLWEFPSVLLEEESSEMKQKRALCAEISGTLGTHLTESLFQSVGEVVHIFSHIHQTYVVHSMRLKDGDIQAQSENAQWLSRSALQEAAVSTGVKKVCVVFPELDGKKRNIADKKVQTSKKPKLGAASSGGRQLSLSSFFKTVKQES